MREAKGGKTVKVEQLKTKIKEAGHTLAETAEALSIDQSTLYRKLQDEGASFTLEQAEKLKSFLCLTNEEATDIFLS